MYYYKITSNKSESLEDEAPRDVQESLRRSDRIDKVRKRGDFRLSLLHLLDPRMDHGYTPYFRLQNGPFHVCALARNLLQLLLELCQISSEQERDTMRRDAATDSGLNVRHGLAAIFTVIER